LQLPPDLAADQGLVLEKILNLLSACVDVMSSNAWLNALGAMDLSQMCVQAMWERDSPLKQIPHFESEVCNIMLCKVTVSLMTVRRSLSAVITLGSRRFMILWRWRMGIVRNFCK
jgi:hypothetical protein